MDISGISAWVPAPAAWLEPIREFLVSRKNLENALEQHRKVLLQKAFTDLESVGVNLRTDLGPVIASALEFCREQKPELIGSIYLISLEGAQRFPDVLGDLPKTARAYVAKVGWWSLFDPTWKRGELSPGISQLSPSDDLCLRLALRLRQNRIVRASDLIKDLEALPGLPRRDGARVLSAYLRRQKDVRVAPKGAFHDLSLRTQLLFCESPALVRAFFGTTLKDIGVASKAVKDRWERTKRFTLQWKNITRVVQARRWDAVDHALAVCGELPDTRDRLAHQERIGTALQTPISPKWGTEIPAWGIPTPLLRTLCTFTAEDRDALKLLRFLAMPVGKHVAQATLNPGYLGRKPNWVPLEDWKRFLAHCQAEHGVELTNAMRFDLLSHLDLGPLAKNPKVFLPFLGQRIVQRAFSSGCHQPVVMRSLVKALDGPEASSARSILVDWAESSRTDNQAVFEAFLSSFKSVRSLQSFLPSLKHFPTEDTAFLSALEGLKQSSLRPLWIDYLIEKNRNRPPFYRDWVSCISKLLRGSPTTLQWFISKGSPADRVRIIGLLQPLVRTEILRLIASGMATPALAHRQALQHWAAGAIRQADAAECLALSQCFPEFDSAVEARLAETLIPATPEVFLEALDRFPGLLPEWGKQLKGTRGKALDGAAGATVMALRAAFRPSHNWTYLEALPEAKREQAIASALVLLRTQTHRHALLELGGILGVRWMPAIAAAAASSREGSGETGGRLDHLYKTYELPKKSGGTRLITVPPGWLKRLQRQINDVLLAPLGAHPCSHGFVKGRSIVSNAEGHVGKVVVVGCDIKAAFPSTSWRLVRYALRRDLGEHITPQALFLLVDLCCHGGGLPIGAPTSPALLNRVLLVADNTLQTEADARNVTYTRYADDLCFSGDTRALELLPVARRMLASAGLALDPKKTNIFRRGRRQMVTGLVVNDQASTPRRLRRNLRAAVHRMEKGLEPEWHGNPMDTQSLRGRLAFVQMVNPEEATRLVVRLKAVLQPEP